MKDEPKMTELLTYPAAGQEAPRSFVPYLAASVAALLIDYFVLLALASPELLRESVAAALAYAVGGVAHYLISRRWVFPPGWLHVRPISEFAAFMASAVFGLVVTAGIVFVATEVAAIPLFASKSAAVMVSFLGTYLLRRFWVFRLRGCHGAGNNLPVDQGA